MKKVLESIFSLLILCLSIYSCSNGGDTPSTIIVPNKEELNQSFTAHQNDGGIHFNAQAPWSASISTESRTEKEWIEINPKSGAAGDNQTINITLKENKTGIDRTAIITIVCGETIITITIKQSNNYEGDNGEKPEPPQSDLITAIAAFGIDKTTKKETQLYVTNLEYQNNLLIKAYSEGTFIYGGGTTSFTSEFLFNPASKTLKIQSKEESSYGNVENRTETWKLETNEKGYITSALGNISLNGKLTSEVTNRFTYTDDGRLATNFFFQQNSYGEQDGPSTIIFNWENENLVSIGSQESGELWEKMDYSEEKNKNILDLNYIMLDGYYPNPDYTLLIMNLGKPSANLQSKHYTLIKEDYDNKPHTTSTPSHSRSNQFRYEVTEINYEKDEKGRIAAIRYKYPKETVSSIAYSEATLYLKYSE